MKLSRNPKIKNTTLICSTLLFIFTLPQCFASSFFLAENTTNANQYTKEFEKVFKFVQSNYVEELDPRILYEGALKGMMEAIGDPYTVYLDSEQMRDLTDTTAGSFGGVGLSISKPVASTPDKPAYVEVASPIEDSPGFKAGIQAGDLIIKVEGESTAEMTMNQVLDRLRGEIGTPVTITILRGKNMTFDVTLVRALIEVPTVKYTMIEGTKIGYIRLIQFTPETPNRVQDALENLDSQGFDRLIIDLRDNPGGLISSVVEIADKFIDEGPIVTTKSRLAYENIQYSAKQSKTVFKQSVPIVVLINRGSASASEILSGCLKDYHKAILVGQRTYGKGSVQQVIPLSNIDGIKITMARYYTPSDVNIDKIGIPPDFEIKNLEDFTEEEEKIYIDMITSKIITKSVEEKPDMTEEEIAACAEKIYSSYPVEKRLIRRLVRNEANRTKSDIIIDRDYDIQLNEAIKYVLSDDFNEIVMNTKTLKQLQEEVEDLENK